MWLVPYTIGGDHVITITLRTPAMVTGLQIWNYNKSPEDTRRGVCHYVLLPWQLQVVAGEGSNDHN